MASIDFKPFDADHHYYEAEDAFTRHVDKKMQRRCIQWAEINGRKRLLVGGKINNFIPNPTFDPVAKPGILDEFFRGNNPENKSIVELFGELEPINPAYRDRDVRVDQIKQQGLRGVMMFPTLGVGMQEALRGDPEAACAAFSGFNLWLEEDWGFSYQDVLYAAPYISLMDPEWAVKEVEAVIARGARLISMVPGPIPYGEDGGRSPGHPDYDRFWSVVAEAGITVAYHSGDSGYRRHLEMWGGNAKFKAFDTDPLIGCLSASAIHDTIASLVCHGVFERHPKLRVASIESGSDWVPTLIAKLKKAYGQMSTDFQRDPVEQLREHVWIAPYYEDDLLQLKSTIGAERILFGSDYPHAEGLPNPLDFVHELKGFSDEERKLVMHDNAMSLLS
ncbi:amidohydrolase family protein [Parahaliea sp. F7430]|uniref:Amidohydrolase family protein n=1 Tax=Sediminihaliea albiluteola TaxID=2758564 RepID=A0A7W2TUK4_9GAMM|nr:amidohydrolase family protein [Sediminihaliea albiluteola]MBA6412242.1 amidohydrolase family protein [Sediminihaliea albiluteola]